MWRRRGCALLQIAAEKQYQEEEEEEERGSVREEETLNIGEHGRENHESWMYVSIISHV